MSSQDLTLLRQLQLLASGDFNHISSDKKANASFEVLTVF